MPGRDHRFDAPAERLFFRDAHDQRGSGIPVAHEPGAVEQDDAVCDRGQRAGRVRALLGLLEEARVVDGDPGAARDLEELYEYIAQHDLPGNAGHVLDRIEQALASLTQSPERGTFPKELLALGIREYREIFFKPYRILYRVIADKIYVLLIADGRRDMQALLERRLLGS